MPPQRRWVLSCTATVRIRGLSGIFANIMKVLISDKCSPKGIKILQETKGIEVLNQPGLGKDIDKLKEVIADVDAIIIRSATKLKADILSCAKKLKVIARAGIGVDNVDIPAASKQGIIVMNTPFGNTVTTAEHAIAMMFACSRQIPQATASIRAGKWEKNAFMGSEIFNKTLGLIGAGNIGKIVADRAAGLKMNVIVYDPFLTEAAVTALGAKKVELDDLYKTADYITIHTPKNEKTAGMVNKQAFEKMKKGVFIINCARGGIINEIDLCAAIENGIVAGAALDVFEKEPVDPHHPLLKSDKVIFTPHLGASTHEAQDNVAIDAANQIAAFLTKGELINALNADAVKK
ncbi:MAG: phosphoglycerate dehydrogenase [Deltaproteobacteria bacterium]|nr:phosphoglycerate dehydrogenase [Deltaproteobacteria bacterium]